MGKIGIAIAAGALTAMAASTAAAQDYVREGPYLRQQIRAPRLATEIGLSAGYTQGFGDIMQGQRVGTVADAGFAPGITLGFRATPHVSLAWSGQYNEFKADDSLAGGTNVRGLVTGLEAGFHFAPYERIDPHLSLGAGYRMLWLVPEGPSNNTMIHGFELAKLQAGLDVRASQDVAIGPVIGADLNLFAWRNPEGAAPNVEIADKRVNTFIYGGMQGRFDLGGLRERRPVAIVGGR